MKIMNKLDPFEEIISNNEKWDDGDDCREEELQIGVHSFMEIFSFKE